MPKKYNLKTNYLNPARLNGMMKRFLDTVTKDRAEAERLLKACKDRLVDGMSIEEFSIVISSTAKSFDQMLKCSDKLLKAMDAIDKYSGQSASKPDDGDKGTNLFATLSKLTERKDKDEETT